MLVCAGSPRHYTCVERSGDVYEWTSCIGDPARADYFIRARWAVGYFPQPYEPSDRVVVLYSPPRMTPDITLREGAVELPLPTRNSLLRPGFIAVFTLATRPGPAILYRHLLELEVDPGEGGPSPEEVVAILEKLYGGNLEPISLSRIREESLETRHYRVYWDPKRKRVVFEVVR